MNTRLQWICTLEATTVGRPRNSNSHLLVDETEYSYACRPKKTLTPRGPEWGRWNCPLSLPDCWLLWVRSCDGRMSKQPHTLEVIFQYVAAPLALNPMFIHWFIQPCSRRSSSAGSPGELGIRTEPWAGGWDCMLRGRPLSLRWDILMPQLPMLNNIIFEFV